MDNSAVTTTPVDHDPFNPVTTPVDYDPFAAASLGPALSAVGGTIGQFARNVGPWAQQQGQNLLNAVTLPHDVMTGAIDPTSPEGFARAQTLAGLATGIPFETGAIPVAEMAENLASKSPRLYNPPSVAPRPFEADYPTGGPSDASGNLTHDIEGRPLTARYVVGRQVAAGDDQAIPSAELDSLTEAITGNRPQGTPSRLLRGDAGQYRVEAGPSGPVRNIYLSNQLTDAQVPRVLSHEFGHAIDDLSGGIPQAGQKTQLGQVYNDLNNPSPSSSAKRFTPATNGYSAAESGPELNAEAIRAYMTDPNYLKTVAPAVAKSIRAAVNANPRLSSTIQFNTGGVPVLSLTPIDHDPFASQGPPS